MNLRELRQQFVVLSGRYDLQNDNGSDNGATFFINAGQRFLDRQDNFKHCTARIFDNLSAGDFFVTTQRCRAVQKVYVVEAGALVELEKIEYNEFRSRYGRLWTQLTGEWSVPKVYAISMLRTNPDQHQGAASEFKIPIDLMDTQVGEYFQSTGILVYPPSDVDRSLVLEGLFYSPNLYLDVDRSYWTEASPETLLKAALYQLEVFHRNTEGANDWLRAIREDITSLGMDVVEEEYLGINEMGG